MYELPNIYNQFIVIKINTNSSELYRSVQSYEESFSTIHIGSLALTKEVCLHLQLVQCSCEEFQGTIIES